MKAIVINGSPRKNWNAAKAIDSAAQGMKDWGYDEALKQAPKSMGEIMGYCETLNIYNTYQFKDYSRYDLTLFDESAKRAYRDSHFDIDLRNAYELGRRIAERAKSVSQ